jgi:hypothetical protein
MMDDPTSMNRCDEIHGNIKDRKRVMRTARKK